MTRREGGYIPDPPTDPPLRASHRTLVGNPHEPTHHTAEMAVALGKEDIFNRDPWRFWAQTDDGTQTNREAHPKAFKKGDPLADEVIPENWAKFNGHWVRVGIDFKSWNRREVNDWKGRDEIRATGEWYLYFNEQVVYGGTVGSDPLETMLTIRRIAQQLLGDATPIDWRKPGREYELEIVGKEIYYRDVPATIRSWIPDQGCIMVEPVEGRRFPTPAYVRDDDHDDATEWDAEYGGESKVEMLSPDIWWYRR